MNHNIIQTILAVIGFIYMVLTADWGDIFSQSNTPPFVIGIASLIFIIYTVCEIAKAKRDKKATRILWELQSRADSLESELPQSTYEICHAKMYNVCSKISDAFTELKGTKISVCIKIVNKTQNEDLLITLARDNDSKDEREKFDEKKDRLNDNSDFCYLMSQHDNENRKWKDIYYIANNLPHKYGYYNSHLNEQELSNGICGFIVRHHQWKLPYKSTLIVAIANNTEDIMYAFLCIDSKKTNGFNSEDLEHLRNAALSIWKIVYITLGKFQNEQSEQTD